MTFLEFRDAALELTSLIPGCCTKISVEHWRFANPECDSLDFMVYVDVLPDHAKARTPTQCLAALDQMIAEHLRTLPDVDQLAEQVGELEAWPNATVTPVDGGVCIELEQPKPRSVIWFRNGTAAVCDQHGQQMPKYQQGDHAETRRLLEADGIDWHTLEASGYPQIEQPSVAHSPNDANSV